jgi:ketosteroid isomerase-like protein
MAHLVAERFIHALQKLESGHEEEDKILELFTDDAEVSNQVSRQPFRGREGARRFWRDYRNLFSEVRSRITRVHDCGEVITLEWVTEGALAASGERVRYQGLSILECQGGRVRRFKAWFDSAALWSAAGLARAA